MKKFLSRTGLVLVFFTILTCNIGCSKDNSDTDIEEEITTTILQLVNEHRLGIGKQVLEVSTLAEDLAKEHNIFMISQGDISHDNFDYRADRLFDEENAKGVGENVAAKQKSAQDVMTDWLESKGHRENIEGDFTHIGISAIKNENGHYYYTQLFLKK
ncbi:CAP domain-containing protein [Flavivirga aquimarina]|uniref:CAP domain-containing protein n=1 Tax=Flavivirga aquimarina TaxID=2027862 RepID=A0ABT8W8A6_9FLAO|nr:CAP domain-containing protein [Flavivirga aquimarina]MDO5969359.1 CAP domain-containing protein [Flavivirga aquimarina]